MKVAACQVNHVTDPVGYRLTYPIFSWKVEDAKGTKQRDARIRIALTETMYDCILDTGYQADINSLAYKAEIALLPCTRYYWNVSVRSDRGEEAKSAASFFETGKMNAAWTGKWITCDSTVPRHPIFEKKLSLRGAVKTARLYICGLGLYEAYLGGEKVGKEHLTPYCNNYNSWLQYQTYDITEQLQMSDRLRVLLGNGWYKGRFGSHDATGKGNYGDTWSMIAEVHVDYADGTQQVIGTDETWMVRRSRIIFSNIYDGEQRDDTLDDVEIVPATLCTKEKTPGGKLTERMSTPVTVHEEIAPIELIHTPAGETVLDLGQNFAGIFRLHVKEPAGTSVHLQFGEILQQGNFYRDNLRTAKAEYMYTSDGVEKDIVPHFTFYGYRYVKIEGIAEFKKEDFTGLALYSALTPTGTLTTGNELVNQLLSNTRWGLKSNFVDIPTDCPQRDERMGWTGDAQVFSPTACYLNDSYAFYAKYLHDIAEEQESTDGMVPDVIPSFGNNACSSAWGDAACIIPWNMYTFYGDKDILEAQFESMKSWVDYITSVDGTDAAWGRHFHYGDWLALDNPAGNVNEVMGGTDTDFIAYVYYMGSAMIVARAAGVLGKTEAEKSYRALAKKIKSCIQDEFYSKTGRCCIDTQTALLLTLKYQLSVDTARIGKKLRKRLSENDDKLKTGFVGTPILCEVLSENGISDLAYKLLLNEDYPGWLYEIKLGATTIWERWNSVLEDGSISSTGMNSLNHYSYGSIVEWLFAYAAGIRQQEGSVGFKKAYLAPELNWKLRHLEAEYRSPAGTYKLSWRITDPTHVEMDVTVPFDCEAKLALPNVKKGTMQGDVKNDVSWLSAGEYHIAYESAHPLKKTLSSDSTVREIMGNSQARTMFEKSFPHLQMLPKSSYDSTLRDLVSHFAGTIAASPDLTEKITETAHDSGSVTPATGLLTMLDKMLGEIEC